MYLSCPTTTSFEAICRASFLTATACKQCAKKVVSNSPGLVDFAVGLVFFVLNLPDGQVLFFGEIQITEGLLSILPIKRVFWANWNDLWATTCYLQLARMAGCKTDFLCTLARIKIVVVVVVAHMQLTSGVHIKYHESVTCFDVISIRTLQGPNMDTSNTFLK